MRSNLPLIASFILLTLAPAQAAAAKPLTGTQQSIETAGTAVAIALPVTAAGAALYNRDYTGAAQLGLETALTLGTVYALKNIVRERRPDGSDWHSFPSGTTALAASGSSFLWRRYGWDYGLPAFALTQFVSYSRVQAKEHHWYDTLASSAISWTYAFFVTTRYRGSSRFDTQLSATPDSAYLQMSYRW